MLRMTDDSRREEYLYRLAEVDLEIEEMEAYAKSKSGIQEPADAATNKEYQRLLADIETTLALMEERIAELMMKIETDFPFEEISDEEARKLYYNER